MASTLDRTFDALDPRQRAAVTTDATTVYVRAGVGSGKTTVIAGRAVWLHLARGVPLDRIAVLTFTTQAAGEMRDRIEGLLGVGQRPVLVATLHAAARSLLQRHLPIEVLGWRRGFRVLSAGARAATWRRLIEVHRLTIRYRSRLDERMEALARDGRLRMGAMKTDDDLATLAARYVEEKRVHNALDFDDLMASAAFLLGEPDIVAPFAHVLVDEVQDCAPAELALLRGLAPAGVGLYAVGDPRQSVYGWRGARPAQVEGLLAARHAEVHELARNYRSREEIVAAAQVVLALPTPDPTQRMQCTRGATGHVEVTRHHDAVQEAVAVASAVRARHAAGSRWDQCAVLARTHRQLAVVREACLRAGVPTCEAQRDRTDDDPAALWVADLLRAALGAAAAHAIRDVLCDDRFGLLPRRLLPLRLLRRPNEGGPKSSDSRAPTEPQTAGLTHVCAVLAGRIAAGALTPARDLALLHGAAALCGRLAGLHTALAAGASVAATAEAALDLPSLLRPAARDQDRSLRAARELLADLGAAVDGVADPIGALLGALDHLATDGALAVRAAVDPRPAAVHLLTLHACKGLEFEAVFLIGLNQGVLPPARAWGRPDEDAEERRLLYVGMTRARDGVALSWVQNPSEPGALGLPSQYLTGIAAPVTPLPMQAAAAQDGSPALGWAVGERVRHSRYGAGTVRVASASEVRVAFDAMGERGFSSVLCPLVPG
ncbi:MAG: ATP-dependent helicase [Myxococcales bacterium]|nr:ATP-dependent helicase [Myxococcales bacterium]